MPFDSEMAARVRMALAETEATEKRMFSRIGFLLGGNVACGILGEALIVRVGPHAYGRALALPHVKPFDLTGREMKGVVMVAPEGTGTEADVGARVRLGIAFAGTLPIK